jgi:hypothetical protein
VNSWDLVNYFLNKQKSCHIKQGRRHLSVIKGNVSKLRSTKDRVCAKLNLRIHPTNRKPVEKQGRKVMGLKLWKHNQDRQTAEDHIIVFPTAGLANVRPVFV